MTMMLLLLRCQRRLLFSSGSETRRTISREPVKAVGHNAAGAGEETDHEGSQNESDYEDPVGKPESEKEDEIMFSPPRHGKSRLD